MTPFAINEYEIWEDQNLAASRVERWPLSLMDGDNMEYADAHRMASEADWALEVENQQARLSLALRLEQDAEKQRSRAA